MRTTKAMRLGRADHDVSIHPANLRPVPVTDLALVSSKPKIYTT